MELNMQIICKSLSTSIHIIYYHSINIGIIAMLSLRRIQLPNKELNAGDIIQN